MENVKTPHVLWELIDDRAEKNGEKAFLFFKDQKVSYEEIRLYSNRCANAFHSLGVSKGDKVSIMLSNCPEFLYIWFGLAKIGAVEVPVNTAYKGEYLRHIIVQSDSKIVMIAVEYLDRLELIEEDLKKVEKVVILGDIQGRDIKLKIPTMSFDEFFNNSEEPVDVAV